MKSIQRLLTLYMFALMANIAQAETIPDISKPFRSSSAVLLTESPQFYRDKSKPHLYHVLPKAFRVIETDGRPLKSAVKLPNGRLILSARLGPWPRDFKSDAKYQELASQILAEDREATFVSPTFKSPSVKLMGPIAQYAESVTISGSTSGSNELFVTIKVSPDYASRCIEDLKRPLGLLGVVAFKVAAFNGVQNIDWPVSFSWHLGDITVP